MSVTVVPFEAALDLDLHSACLELGDIDHAIATFQTPDIRIPRELENAVSRRQAEFLAGRYAAELALANLGITGVVERASNGAPLWPQGVVGSITHGGGLVAAVVGSASHYAGIGIDAEPLIATSTAGDVETLVADRTELGVIAGALRDLQLADTSVS